MHLFCLLLPCQHHCSVIHYNFPHLQSVQAICDSQNSLPISLCHESSRGNKVSKITLCCKTPECPIVVIRCVGGGETCDQPTFNVTKGRFAQYPSKFGLLIPNIFCGLVTRWIPEINPNYLKNFLPSSQINNNLPCRGRRIRRENSFNCRVSFFFFTPHCPGRFKKKIPCVVFKPTWIFTLSNMRLSTRQLSDRPPQVWNSKKSKALIKHSPGTLPHLCGGTT